jgi:hypothetical protein
MANPFAPAPPAVASDDPRLWNLAELSEALGVSREYVLAMKRFGFRMPLGRASVQMAHDWLKENAHLLADVGVKDAPRQS